MTKQPKKLSKTMQKKIRAFIDKVEWEGNIADVCQNWPELLKGTSMETAGQALAKAYVELSFILDELEDQLEEIRYDA